MRRLIALLFSLILVAFLISCSNSIAQESSITIDAGQAVSKAITVSRTIKNRTIPQKGESDLTDAQLAALDKAMELSVDLKVGVTGEFEKSVENNYSFSLSQMEDPNPQNIIPVDKIRITSIPVGKKVKVTAQLIVSTKIKDASALVEFALAEEDSELSDVPQEMLEEYILSEFGFYNYAFIGESQQITIHEGENPVSVPLQFDENYEWEEGDEEYGIPGEIEPVLPEKLTIKIDEEASDAKLYLNDGKIAFKLLDESGNALEPDPNSNHDYFAIWNFKLSLKGTEIPATGDASTYNKQIYSPNSTAGTIEFKNLPASGTYQLYVQATPTVTQYVSSATTSAVFDVKIENSYGFNASNLMKEDPSYELTDEFTEFIDSITVNSCITVYGETPESYASVFQPVSNYIKDKNLLYDFDFSDMTTSSTSSTARKVSGYEFQNCDSLNSIILPKDLVIIGNGAFKECTNLKTVVFGSNLEMIESDACFSSCSKLSSVIIPEDAPLVHVGSATFSGTSSLKTLTLPASVTQVGGGAFGVIETLTLLDETGTWYYTSRQEEWTDWIASNTQDPASSSYNHEYGFGSLDAETLKDSNNEAISGFPASGSVSEKLLFASQNTAYYFYCVK